MATFDMADMVLRVRDILNEPVAALVTDAEIQNFINDGQRDIAQRAACYQVIDASASTLNGTRTVPLTGTIAGMYKAEAVEYLPVAGTKVALRKILPKQVGRVPVSGSTPQFWFEFGNIIGIEPVPDSTYNLNIYGVSAPSEISTGTPVIPRQYWNLIILYAFYRCLLKENTSRSYAQAQQIYAMYLNEIHYYTYDFGNLTPDSKADLSYQ